MQRPIYLDNNASTPIDPRVLKAMMPFLTEQFGNAASQHSFGQMINKKVNHARVRIGKLLGCRDEEEIIFTSGATEAINLALKGVVENYSGKRNHIVTVSTEHPAVLDTCRYLESKGAAITYLPVQLDGLLDLEVLKSALRPETLLVCVMYANNETGVIQPIKEIAEMAHGAEAFFMTDATQAVGKIPVDVEEMGIDLLAFSGHKLYGPKGIGGLYVRSRGKFKVRLAPLMHGGGHERGFRSGTLNVPGIVGLGMACEIANKEMKKDAERLRGLRDELEKALLKIEGTKVIGNTKHRLPHVANVYFEGVDSDALIIELDNISVSSGSACSSAKVEPSHVLVAMGLTELEAYSYIRFSLGRFNTKDEIDITVKKTSKSVEALKLMTP